MLMSKSRLEKFLYALYSLDSSDLPTPLSRIEELYKCWVTGEEAPSFEPISRVEKYLMAILGVYDVNELPNPLSRVEVLLYKLATGDDNLDGFDTFLSKHEELLAEIIRNGGVGGNIDIEYVLYTLSTEFNTLYNTAEKPVKSAILKGNTLINISNAKGTHELGANKVVDSESVLYKNSTTYTIIFNAVTNGIKKIRVQEYRRQEYAGAAKDYTIIDGLNKFTYTTSTSNTFNNIRLRNFETGSDVKLILSDLMIIEGDYTNVDIPFFEGMQSVKMPVLTTTGKNVFNPNWLINKDTKHAVSIVDGNVILNGEFTRTATWFNFKLPKGTYKATNFNTSDISIHVLWKGKDSFFTYNTPLTYDTETTVEGYITKGVYVNHVLKLQLESITNQSTYESYKSNILTVNEEVELRGIGEVQDELNLLTGELTERIGEITFDGSDDEIWARNSTLSNNYETSFFALSVDNVKRSIGHITKICDKFPVLADYGHTKDIEGVTQVTDNQMSIRVLKTSLSDDSVEGLKAYLQSNPITVRYQFITKSVKTVDLSVVDQYGNNTKLSTFNDITYVTLSSEGLIPEAELEVATKNEEVLNTMSLEMDDISTTQTTLEETSNTQSENVDATMIATTEIYEELL